jgi:hypothetical protein
MNTILNIIPWALAILAGVLYYFSRKKAKHAEFLETHSNTLEKMIEEKERENIRVKKDLEDKSGSIATLKGLVNDCNAILEKNSLRIRSLEEDSLRLQNQLDQAQELNESYENNLILKPVNGISFQGIFEKLGEMQFTNSAIILGNGQIKLRAIELLHQDHITAIQKLQKAGLFPENLLEDEAVFKFDPKTLEVTIQMISLNKEGSPTGFGTWDWFLFCRDEFIAQLSDYISNLLQEGKRHEIAQQVIAEITAPAGSEVTSA